MATSTSTVSRPAPIRKSERTSMLARLLATENITVLHDAGAHTASFNLRERTLILPCWRTDNQRVYDFLVGHEVGHAKHTPSDAWLAGCISIGGTNPRAQMVAKDFLNVVEDARIERAIKREFPGLRHDFVEGYRVLHRDLDIFKAHGRDVSGLPLIDRLNLHFKIGVHCGEVIPFSADEAKWVDAVAACRTWDDVVEVARDLYNLAKDEKRDGSMDGTDSQDGENGESQDGKSQRGQKRDGDESDTDASRDGERGEVDEDADGESQDLTDAQDGDGESQDGDEGEQTEDGNADGESGDTESQDAAESQDAQDADSEGNAEAARTDGEDRADLVPDAPSTVKQFERGMGHFAQADYTEQTLRVEEMNLSKVVMSSDRFIELARQVEDVYGGNKVADPTLVEETAAKMFKNVTDANARGVDLMVKRFEQRRAALNFARQSSHKTGRISTRHLSKYKFSEDIFDRVVIQPDQQNHGIVILLDWSGSMGGIVYQTAKQMLSLVQFCRRVGIPAKVSIFTTAASAWGIEKFGEAKWREMSGGFCGQGGFRDISLDFTDDVFGLPAGTTKAGGHITLMPFSIIDIYDSRMDNRKFAKVMGLFLLTASLNGNRGEIPEINGSRNQIANGHRTHPHLALGYTPLDESILAMRGIVNEFRKSGNQKVTLIAMTDGDGNSLDWAHGSTNAAAPNSRRFSRVIIDGTTGRRFDFGATDRCPSTTLTAAEMFKDATGCDFVNISLCEGGQLRSTTSTVYRAINDAYEIPSDYYKASPKMVEIFETLEKKFNTDGMVHIDGNSTKWFFVKVEGNYRSNDEFKTQRRLDKMKNRAVAETRAFIAAQKKEASNRNFINSLMDCVS